MTTTAASRPLQQQSFTGHAAQPLAGLGTLVRFVARRNRTLLIVWPVVIAGLFAYVTAYYRDLLSTQKALDDFAAISNTASIKALTGLAAEPGTLGGAVWTKIWMTSALLLAFAAVFMVTRTGRADEEAGRTELLRSRVVGVHAYAAASWIVTAAMCGITGLAIAAAGIAGGLDPAGQGITGSLIVGASVAAVGLVGLAVSALTGQVAATSRAANATASAVLGLMYMLRMVGDVGSGTLTWFSPIGWGQQMQPWGANRWWPLGLSVVLVVVLLVIAVMVQGRRDLGLGLLPQRHGRPAAPHRWTRPVGLALHLERGVIAGWTVTMMLAGLMFGSVVPAMSELVADASGPLVDVVGGAGVEALLSLLVSMLALIATAFAVQTTVTNRQQEASGIIEPQLAGGVSRASWVLQRFLIPAVGSALLLGLGGLMLGVGYASAGGDIAPLSVVWAALTYWPAVMLLTAVGVFLFGWLPEATIPGAWAVVGGMWVLVVAGDALHLPQAVLDAMPLQATPHQPLEPMDWTPVLLMAVLALALIGLGVHRFSRRDIQAG